MKDFPSKHIYREKRKAWIGELLIPTSVYMKDNPGLSKLWLAVVQQLLWGASTPHAIVSSGLRELVWV